MLKALFHRYKKFSDNDEQVKPYNLSPMTTSQSSLLNVADKILDDVNKIIAGDPITKILIFLNRNETLVNRYNNALSKLETALAIYKKTDNNEKICQTYQIIARIKYIILSTSNTTTSYTESDVISAYLQSSSYAKYVSYDIAIKNLGNIISIYEKLGDHYKLGKYNENLGDFYIKNKIDFTKAHIAYQEAIRHYAYNNKEGNVLKCTIKDATMCFQYERYYIAYDLYHKAIVTICEDLSRKGKDINTNYKHTNNLSKIHSKVNYFITNAILCKIITSLNTSSIEQVNTNLNEYLIYFTDNHFLLSFEGVFIKKILKYIRLKDIEALNRCIASYDKQRALDAARVSAFLKIIKLLEDKCIVI